MTGNVVLPDGVPRLDTLAPSSHLGPSSEAMRSQRHRMPHQPGYPVTHMPIGHPWRPRYALSGSPHGPAPAAPHPANRYGRCLRQPRPHCRTGAGTVANQSLRAVQRFGRKTPILRGVILARTRSLSRRASRTLDAGRIAPADLDLALIRALPAHTNPASIESLPPKRASLPSSRRHLRLSLPQEAADGLARAPAYSRNRA